MHRAMEDQRSSVSELPIGLFREPEEAVQDPSGQPFIFPGSGNGAPGRRPWSTPCRLATACWRRATGSSATCVSKLAKRHGLRV